MWMRVSVWCSSLISMSVHLSQFRFFFVFRFSFCVATICLLNFSLCYSGNVGEMLPHTDEKLPFGQFLPSAIQTPATMECQSRISRLFWYVSRAHFCAVVRMFNQHRHQFVPIYSHLHFLLQVVQSEMRVCTQPLLRSSRSIR